jgi:hypothetical protein
MEGLQVGVRPDFWGGNAQGETVSVRGTRSTLLALLTPLIVVGIVVAVASARALRLNVDIWGYLGGILLASGAAGWSLWSIWRAAIREVTVSTNGVTLRTGRETIAVSWSAVLPFRYPAFLGEIGLEYRVGDGFGPDSVRGVLVTPRQALAILAHPSCPRWEVPLNVRASLKLPDSGLGT